MKKGFCCGYGKSEEDQAEQDMQNNDVKFERSGIGNNHQKSFQIIFLWFLCALINMYKNIWNSHIREDCLTL